MNLANRIEKYFRAPLGGQPEPEDVITAHEEAMRLSKSRPLRPVDVRPEPPAAPESGALGLFVVGALYGFACGVVMTLVVVRAL